MLHTVQIRFNTLRMDLGAPVMWIYFCIFSMVGSEPVGRLLMIIGSIQATHCYSSGSGPISFMTSRYLSNQRRFKLVGYLYKMQHGS